MLTLFPQTHFAHFPCIHVQPSLLVLPSSHTYTHTLLTLISLKSQSYGLIVSFTNLWLILEVPGLSGESERGGGSWLLESHINWAPFGIEKGFPGKNLVVGRAVGSRGNLRNAAPTWPRPPASAVPTPDL